MQRSEVDDFIGHWLTSFISCSKVGQSRVSQLRINEIRTCQCCLKKPPCNRLNNYIKCESCQKKFRGQKCLENPKVYKICEKIKKCSKCLTIIITGSKKHDCGMARCKTCGTDKP